jgi:predicted PurR-regulated permease PerM
MAILGVIPYIGNILCLIPACIIAYLHARARRAVRDGSYGHTSAAWWHLRGRPTDQLAGHRAKIVGDSVGLHPLTVIFSMLFWSLVLGGFVGALLAVPLTACGEGAFSAASSGNGNSRTTESGPA